VFLVPTDEKGPYYSLLDSFVAILEARGYREGPDIRSFQEHRLMGSTLTVKYAEQPYKPIGILDGKLNLKEVQRARELVVMQSAHGIYYGLEPSRIVKISLEPLDDDGNAIRDPRLLDIAKLDAALATLPFVQALDAATIIAQRSADFPFRRD